MGQQQKMKIMTTQFRLHVSRMKTNSLRIILFRIMDPGTTQNTLQKTTRATFQKASWTSFMISEINRSTSQQRTSSRPSDEL